MVNCKHLECKSKISKIIGYCKSCDKSFCSKHRYPEAHNCPKLLEIKLSSKQDLINRLNENAVEKFKIMKI
jgi:predicted nucleic acid binding AN1-type Zn finger protein